MDDSYIKLLSRCFIKPIATVSPKWIKVKRDLKLNVPLIYRNLYKWNVFVVGNELNQTELRHVAAVLGHVTVFLRYISIILKRKSFLQPYFDNLNRFTFILNFPWKRHIMTTGNNMFAFYMQWSHRFGLSIDDVILILEKLCERVVEKVNNKALSKKNKRLCENSRLPVCFKLCFQLESPEIQESVKFPLSDCKIMLHDNQ